MSNILLHTDVYKMGHMEQYHPDVTHIQSHLIARSDKKFDELVFFGLSYYLQKYLVEVPNYHDVKKFLRLKEMILGQKSSQEVEDKLMALTRLRGWPIAIKAYPEGSLCGIQKPLMTITGHKVLNSKVGMIYGDGMTYDRIEKTLHQLHELGYASQNLVVGVGGLLLQQHNRDDMGFSFKANWAQLKDGSEIPLFKTPKTDPSKNSKGGYIIDEKFKRYYYCDSFYKFLNVEHIDEIRARCK